MNQAPAPPMPQSTEYLERLERDGAVRVIVCSAEGAGKTSMLDRLSADCGSVPEGRLARFTASAGSWRLLGGRMEFARLLDGQFAHDDKGSATEMAYHHFSLQARAYVMAEVAYCESYTRSMLAAAATADLALVVVDARVGIQEGTQRESFLLSLLGAGQMVLVVNKMDQVAYSRDVFAGIEHAYRSFNLDIGSRHLTCIPVSAVAGDNVTRQSDRMGWYRGATLLEILQRAQTERARLRREPFRLPVQTVTATAAHQRAIKGVVAAGAARRGDKVRIQPAGRPGTVVDILSGDAEVPEALPTQSVTLVLSGDAEVSRGDVISEEHAAAEVSDGFEATVVWMGEAPMLRGRDYLMKIGTATVTATVAPLKYRIDVDSPRRVAATELAHNEIGVCVMQLDRPIAFDPYTRCRDTGGFILLDHLSNIASGVGALNFALRRSQNLHWQAIDVNKLAHAELKGQRPGVLWLTGLSGAGKSTIANQVQKRLHALGRHTYVLDGDNVRHGLNKDLGFTEADRVENIRRVAEVAKLMVDAGLIVITAFISPFRSERRSARALFEDGEFIEVFIDAPVEIAEQRDPKGLYRKARRGELKNFTGIDSPYERPETPEMRIDTTVTSADAAADRIVSHLRAVGMLIPSQTAGN